MAGGVGFGGVANFANTYPGTASEVVADADSGNGDAVGGTSVIVMGPIPVTGEYILMEDDSFILQEDDSKIELE